jgi:hypothetical protein
MTSFNSFILAESVRLFIDVTGVRLGVLAGLSYLQELLLFAVF